MLTRRQINRLKHQVPTMKRNFDAINRSYERDIKQAVDNVKHTSSNGWEKLTLNNKEKVVGDLARTVKWDIHEQKRVEHILKRNWRYFVRNAKRRDHRNKHAFKKFARHAKSPVRAIIKDFENEFNKYVNSTTVTAEALVRDDDIMNAVKMQDIYGLPATTLSEDEVMIISAFAVLIVACLHAMLAKKKAFKTHFDIELGEAETFPTPKESKKAIKKTLKNVMSKNQAKATLMDN